MARSPRSRRRPAPKTPPAPRAGGRVLPSIPLALRVIWWGTLALLLAYKAAALERRITWYLAVDQFGYVTMADDFLHGHLLHRWPPAEALAPRLPPRVDILVQAYEWDHGRIYSRYAPGFPLLLAAWRILFGRDAIYYLNPFLFIVLVALVVAYQRRLFGSRWRALVGGALLVLFAGNGFAGSNVSVWSLTLTREMSAHVTGLAGLFPLLPWRSTRLGPRRIAVAAVLLGFAASIRPDNVLYLIPAGSLALARWRRERAPWLAVGRALGAAALAYTLGLAPLLAYNWVAIGNPFRPTQSMEVEQFLSAAPPPEEPVALAQAESLRVGYPSGWHGGWFAHVQGGGLKLSNFRVTIRGTWQLARQIYGPAFLGLALWGACVAAVRRRLTLLASAAYIVPAVLFYSCWASVQLRYLVGVNILLPVLVVEGLFGSFDLARHLIRAGLRWAASALALASGLTLMAAAAFLPAPPQHSELVTIAQLVPVLVGGALLAAAVWPHRWIAGLAAPVLAVVLSGIAITRDAAVAQLPPAGFQHDQMIRARENLRRLVDRNAVVITTEDVGRPAENIEYHGGVYALYTTDLFRWGLSIHDAASLLLAGGLRPYVYLPPTDQLLQRSLQELARDFAVEQVADIQPPQALEHFVAASFHRGVRMLLYRVREKPAG